MVNRIVSLIICSLVAAGCEVSAEELELRSVDGECDSDELELDEECFYLGSEDVELEDAPREPTPDDGPKSPEPEFTLKSWDGGGTIHTSGTIKAGENSNSLPPRSSAP